MIYWNQTDTAKDNGSKGFYYTTSLSPDSNFGGIEQTMPASSPPSLTILSYSDLVSKDALKIVFKALSLVTLFSFGFLGSVLNILNSVVFHKQGLKDPVTITLFSLSVADFVSVFSIWSRSVFFILLFFPGAVPNLEPSYLSGVFTWVHSLVVRVGCFITAFVAFERWVCVTFPLQAHRIITVTVAKGYNLAVIGVLIATSVSLYYYARIKLQFLPSENRSLFILTLTQDGFSFSQRASFIFTVVYIFTFGLLIVFTVHIIIKLKQQTKWRQGFSSATPTTPSTSGPTGNENKRRVVDLSAKSRKVVKMVVTICLIYIFASLPSVINTLAYIYVPGYVEHGRFYNLYQLNNQFCFLFEMINSTCNFFIYFYMSSNFAKTLRIIFRRNE